MLRSHGHYFVTGDGGLAHPFFWLGDTQWQLFRDFSLEDAAWILKTRRRQGFNVIQVMLTGVGDGARPNIHGQQAWLNMDPSTPNPAYFEPVDAIVRMAREEGLILAIYLCHNTQKDFINQANARAYTQWVAQRYREQPHVIYAFVSDVPIADHLGLIRELAGGVQGGGGDQHLISYHPDPVAPALSSGEIHSEPWLDFNMIQTWNYYEGIYGWVRRDTLRQPPKPVVMAEGAYEAGPEYGYPVTPWLVRQQAYWSYLSGGFHSYGHCDNWLLSSDWKANLESPGAKQMTILKDVFSSLEWWNMVPDQGVLISQDIPGSTLNTAARASDGSWLAVYLHRSTTVSLDLGKLSARDKVSARWVDPRDGSTHPAGDFTIKDKPSFTTPAGWEDGLLIIVTA